MCVRKALGNPVDSASLAAEDRMESRPFPPHQASRSEAPGLLGTAGSGGVGAGISLETRQEEQVEGWGQRGWGRKKCTQKEMTKRKENICGKPRVYFLFLSLFYFSYKYLSCKEASSIPTPEGFLENPPHRDHPNIC